MQEPDIEGVANHDDPEPCVVPREGDDEASVGARMGRVLSREIRQNRDADAVIRSGRQNDQHRQREVLVGPARSETPHTCGNFLRENREIPRSPIADGKMGRFGKVNDPTPNVHDRGKSDGSVVPTKRLNDAGLPAEEVVEERDPAKENTAESNAPRTQSRTSAPSALERVRQAAKRDRKQRFTALFHHLTVDRLHNAFLALERKAAAGIDGVTWQQYRVDLEHNLQDLHGRLHRGAYRAKPSRRV